MARRNTYVTMNAAQAPEDNTIKALETNQTLKASKTPSSAVHKLSMKHQMKKSVTNPSFKELSHQVAQYRAVSQMAPVLTAATGLPGQNYQVSIEGNTQF